MPITKVCPNCGKSFQVISSKSDSRLCDSYKCYAEWRAKQKFQDYAGQTFGSLTVIAYRGEHGAWDKWLCRCVCGNEKIYRIYDLLKGTTVSCGCHRRAMGKQMQIKNGLAQIKPIENGTHFGRWTVLEFDQIKNENAHYICRCDCGTIRSVNMRSLITRKSQSCGCYKFEVNQKQAKRLFTKHGLSKEPWYIRFLKRRRYHADREWNTDMNELLFQLQSRCVICGTTERLEVDHVIPTTKGGRLTPGNVVVLCRKCNLKKLNRDLSELPREWQSKIEHAAQEFLNAWNNRAQ